MTGAAHLRTVHVLWRRELLRFARSPLRVAMGLLLPLLFLVVLGTGLDAALAPGAGGDFRAYLFPGAVLMAVQAPALSVGASIVWDRRSGFLRQVLVAPVARRAVLLGVCLGGATTGGAYGALMLTLAPFAGSSYRPGLLLALPVLVLLAFGFTALGVLIAVCIRRPEAFQIVAGLCLMPLLFLSGAVLPAQGLPGWLSGAVLANPLTYGVDALRRTLPGDAEVVSPAWAGWVPPVAVEVAVLALLAVLALGVATARFARPE